MLLTVDEYFHGTYQRPLPHFFLNEPFLEQGSNVSPSFSLDWLAVPASTGCPAIENDDVERIPTTRVLAASSSASPECTVSLDKGPIASLSLVPRALFSSFVPDTVGTASYQHEVSLLPVASQFKVSSVTALSVSLAASSTVLPRAALSSGLVIPSLSDVAKMGRASFDAASPSRSSVQYLRGQLNSRDVEFAKLDDKYIQREKFVFFSRLA